MVQVTSHLPKNVTEIIVSNDICIGCGLCAGICPAKCLEIKFNQFGEYKPFLIGKCLPKCNVCLRICPFYDHETDQDDIAREFFGAQEGIQYDHNVGYHLACYVGYSPTHRDRGASGGMATWMLETLLTKRLVDGVICVAPTYNSEKLFEFTVAKNVDEIRNAASSRYYPVEMSQILRYILSNDERYAIVGIPCFLYGLRLAQKLIPKLKYRIKMMIGLVCGGLPNKFFTEFFAHRVGMKHDCIKLVNYRVKGYSKKSSNYAFIFEDTFGSESPPLMWSKHISFFWSNRFFLHNACNYCDDVFAEVADVVFMDAWLPEYIPEAKGTSLIIVRNSQLLGLIEQGITERTCCFSRIAVERIVQSQAASVRFKKEHIKGRIYRAKQNGHWVPKRREDSSWEVYLTNRTSIEEKLAIQEKSKELWARYGRKGNTWFFLSMMLLTTGTHLVSRLGIRSCIERAYIILRRKVNSKLFLGRTKAIIKKIIKNQS